MTDEELKHLTERINDLEKRISVFERIYHKARIQKRIYFIIVIVSLIIAAVVFYFIFKNIYGQFTDLF